MDLEAIIRIGEKLGYKDQGLREFVDRELQRQKEKEEREYQLEMEKTQLERQKLDQEVKLKHYYMIRSWKCWVKSQK